MNACVDAAQSLHRASPLPELLGEAVRLQSTLTWIAGHASTLAGLGAISSAGTHNRPQCSLRVARRACLESGRNARARREPGRAAHCDLRRLSGTGRATLVAPALHQVLEEAALLALLARTAALLLVVLGVLPFIVRPLGVDEAFELAAIEKDSPAAGALIDEHSISLVAAHLASALRAGQGLRLIHGPYLIRGAVALDEGGRVRSPSATTAR